MPEQQDRTSRVDALEEEIAQLRHAVVSHAVVDQAIGVILAYGGVRPEAAWDVLREVSQHTNIKLRTVAERLVRWPSSLWLPAEIHRCLDTALESRRPAPQRSVLHTSAVRLSRPAPSRSE
ncbi:ANTAR domain-containing protein [Streptomyces populi]